MIKTHHRAVYKRSLIQLSRTCRCLRELTLPLCWARVRVRTVEALEHLLELLRASPSIAQYVQHFEFCWNMGDDYRSWYGLLPAEEGTLLDLAFRDRYELWESLRERYGCQVRRAGTNPDIRDDYFVHDGHVYETPGRAWEVSSSSSCGACPLSGYDARERGDGPDGYGAYETIYDAESFGGSVTEILTQFTSLKELVWRTKVTPIPQRAVDALAERKNLTITEGCQ